MVCIDEKLPSLDNRGLYGFASSLLNWLTDCDQQVLLGILLKKL